MYNVFDIFGLGGYENCHSVFIVDLMNQGLCDGNDRDRGRLCGAKRIIATIFLFLYFVFVIERTRTACEIAYFL